MTEKIHKTRENFKGGGGQNLYPWVMIKFAAKILPCCKK